MAAKTRYFDLSNSLDMSGAQADSEAEQTDKSDAEDSDDAPEAISFASSKQSVLDAKKSLLKFIKDEEKKKKLKRKERDTLMKNQKEEKLRREEEMKSKMLPDDVLEAVSEAIEVIPKKKKKEMAAERKGLQERLPLVATEDFIPLDAYSEATEFKVAVLEARPWQVQKPGIKPSETLSSFRNSMMNRKNIRRETVASHNSKLQKRIASGKAALVK